MRKPPFSDEDMGIVKLERGSAVEREREQAHQFEKPSTMVPRQQVLIKRLSS